MIFLRSVNYDNVKAVSKTGQITNFSREASQELINLSTSSLFNGPLYIGMAWVYLLAI